MWYRRACVCQYGGGGSYWRYMYIYGGVYLCLVPLDGPPDARGIHEPDHALRRRISRQVREFLVVFEGQRIVPWMRPIPVLTCPSAPPFLPMRRTDGRPTKFICASKNMASWFLAISLAASSLPTAILSFFPVLLTGVLLAGGGASAGSSRLSGLCTRMTVAACFA